MSSYSRRRARTEPVQPALFVSNLAQSVTEDALKAFMEHEGIPAPSIKRITLDSRTLQSPVRHALVLFENDQQVAQAANLLSDLYFHGRRLRAQPFDKQPSEKRQRHDEEPSSQPVSNPASEDEHTNRQTPTLQTSGALAKAARTENGIERLYEEPADSAQPAGEEWRMYLFRGDELLTDEGQDGVLYIGRRKYLLLGRDRAVVHVPLDNPSCSKQHAVLQFRRQALDDGVAPYLFDLDSTNGSFLNGQRVPGRTFVELRSKDVLRFGNSSREYVLIHEDL